MSFPRAVWVLLALVLVAGQVLMLVLRQPLWGGALTLLALAAVGVAWSRPRLSRFSVPLALVAAAVAVLAQAVVPADPKRGLLLFALSGLLLFLSQPRDRALLAQGDLPAGPRPFARWEPWAVLGLLVLAAATRFYQLNDLPPGAIGQEGELAGYYLNFMEHASYAPFTMDYGNLPFPTLMVYQGVAFAKLLGWTAGHLRIVAACWGVLSILVFYFVARRLTSPGPALLASLLYSVSMLHLVLTRRFFPYAVLFVPVVLGFGLLAAGIRRPHWALFALAGAAGGLSFHGYDPGRGVFLIFLFWMFGIWLFHRDLLPRPRFLAWFWGSFLLVASPTILHALTHWEGFWFYMNYHANANRGKGLLAYVQQIARAVPVYAQMFHVKSDLDFGQHLPYDPLLDPVSGALFALGLFLCAAMFWKPVPMFLIMALVAGIMPGMLGTNYAHPTTRRVCLALPAVFLLAAMALERLRQVLYLPSRPWLRVLWLVPVLAATGWSVQHGIRHYFVEYANHPGTRAWFNTRCYLAGKEMRETPNARVVGQQRTFGIHDPIMYPRDRDRFPARTPEEMFGLDPAQDTLLFLEPFMEPGLGEFQAAFPNARVRIHRETAMGDPYCKEWDYFVLGTDVNNPDTYLVSLWVPAGDIRSLRSLLDLGRPGVPARLAVFAPEFGAAHAGQRLRLAGSVLTGDGGTFRFSLPWAGWRLRLDGESARWDTDLVCDGGVHDLELSGPVPAGANGPLPLQVLGPAGDLAALGRVVALRAGHGMRLSLRPGVGNWEGKPAVTRRELFPMRRFFDIMETPIPFSARWDGWLRAPRDGTYTFTLHTFTEGRLLVDGRVVFDNLRDRLAPKVAPVRLAAGRPVRVTGNLVVQGELIARTFQMYVQGPGEQEPRWVPVDWFTEQP